MDSAFRLGRYPTDILLSTYKKVSKLQSEFVLENKEPWFSIEFSGFRHDDHTLLNLLCQIEEIDNTVQGFCEYAYQKGDFHIANYLVGLSWVEKEGDEITLGYWGEEVNIELRAILKYKGDHWEILDTYYQ